MGEDSGKKGVAETSKNPSRARKEKCVGQERRGRKRLLEKRRFL